MKRWTIGGLGAAGILALVIWWIRTPGPELVRAGNTAARSFSVGWVTDRPSRGCAAAFESIKHFRKVCIEGAKRTTHLVTIEGLKPETKYSVYIFSGFRIAKLQTLFYRQVSTLSVQDALPKLPQPGYGSVVDKDGRPVSGALVFVYRYVSDRFYFPAAAFTNEGGNYAVDLSNLEQASQPLSVGSYVVEAVGQDGKTTKQIFDREFHSPFPPIKIE